MDALDSLEAAVCGPGAHAVIRLADVMSHANELINQRHPIGADTDEVRRLVWAILRTTDAATSARLFDELLSLALPPDEPVLVGDGETSP